MAERQIRIIITAADQTAKAFSSIRSRFTALSAGLAGWGTQLSLRLTAPILGLATAAAKAAIDYESAFTGVIKTTDGLGDSIRDLTPLGEELYDFFVNLSKEIPVSATELAGIGEIAGQLGVRAEDIDEFTLAIAAIGSATNLSYEQAASGFARFMNIMGLSITNVDEMGSAIVDLGNNFAVTEDEILDTALRLAGVANIAGITAPEVLGWAAVIRAAGIESELGASALQRTWMLINEAVSEGGEGLEGFASVAGLTGEAFAKMWETDPTLATMAFVDGLGKIDEEGGNTIGVLDELGITNVRIVRTLLSLASAQVKAQDTIGLANQAWLDNTAMMTEAERRWATTASQIGITWNMLKAVGIELGEILAPIIRDLLANYIMPLIEWFVNLDVGTQKWILGILAVVAALGPAMLVLSGLVAVLGLIVSPIGLIVVGIAALVAGFIAAEGGIEPAIEALTGLWTTFAELVNPILEDFQRIWDAVWPHIQALITTVLNELVPFAEEMFGKMKTFFVTEMAVIQDWVEQNWPLISQIITTIVDTLKVLFETTWPLIEAAVNTAWENIKTIVDAAIKIVLTTITTIMALITGDWLLAWQGIGTIADTVVTAIQTLIETTLDGILGYFGTSLEQIHTDVGFWFGEIFTTAETWLGDLLKSIEGIATNIYDTVIRPFTDAKKFLSKLHIPVPHVSVSWKAGPLGINIPKFSIKWYGEGLNGIFTRPTLIGVGERGAERVQVTPVGRGANAESRPTYQIIVNAPTGNAQDTVVRMLDALKMLQMGTVPA